jgi:hypothetical protein
MAGGKGKSVGGKGAPKETAGKTQKSHSAKAGLQVSTYNHHGVRQKLCFLDVWSLQKAEQAYS